MADPTHSDDTPQQQTRPWALVLGVSSGFGAATARELASTGFHIAGVHLDSRSHQPQLAALEEELQARGAQTLLFNANAAKAETRARVCEHLQGQLSATSPLRLLVHSLAFGALRPLIAESGEPTIDQRALEMTVDVMGHSLVYWCQDLLTAGLLGENARVIALTSAGSTTTWPCYGAVSAAKAALEAHCRQLARELAPRHITVNALLAGTCDTPALRKIPGHELLLEAALRRHPRQRLTAPQDVARAIVLLCRPEADWITGNTIRVDGGEMICG